MNFALSPEQQAVADRASAIFKATMSPDRRLDTDNSADRIDHAIWSDLADADLLGITIPLEQGGLGMGMEEAVVVLREQGRAVAPLPLWTTLVAAGAISAVGSTALQAQWLPTIASGQAVVSMALENHASAVDAVDSGDVLELTGAQGAVPFWGSAHAILVPAFTDAGSVAVCLVDPHAHGVAAQVAETTNRELHATLTFDGVVVPRDNVLDGQSLPAMLARAQVAAAAIVLGSAEESLRLATIHASTRQQFGRLLSAKQAVRQQAADAYIDLQCMEATLLRAASSLDNSDDYSDVADDEIAIAKWWASSGGRRVVQTAQHLFGAAGATMDNPVHRHFLWVHQLVNSLGGVRQQQARLGSSIARNTSNPGRDTDTLPERV